jgi:hypothetical protein
MKYNRVFYGIKFVSDTVTLSDKRMSDLFAIAYNSLHYSGDMPGNKQISILLMQHGVKAVEIIVDPYCKWQFKAEFLY